MKGLTAVGVEIAEPMPHIAMATFPAAKAGSGRKLEVDSADSL